MTKSGSGIENSENSDFHNLFNNGARNGNGTGDGGRSKMAKKNGPPGPPKPQGKREISRYFPTQYSVQSNEIVKGRFQVALATLASRANLSLLDQSKLNNQALNNAMMLWIARKIEEGQVAWVEKQLQPVMEELTVIVAKDMIERDREFDPAYLPEGVSLPRKKKKKEGEEG